LRSSLDQARKVDSDAPSHTAERTRRQHNAAALIERRI